MMKIQPSRRMAVVALLLVLIFISITMTGCGLGDGKKYKVAVELFENSQYDDAIAAFSEIKEYEDSSTYIMYIKTLQLAESGEYALAASTFEAMNDFKDSKYFSVYYSGRQAEKEQRYEDADALYRTIAVFSDCTARLKALPDLILERDFDIAVNGLKDECWDEEDAEAFVSLVSCVYSDSPIRMLQNIYDLADKTLKNGNYEVAKELFLLLSEKEYSNASIRVQECRFEHAKVMLKKEEYEEAAAFIQTYLREYEEAAAVYAKIPDLVLKRDFDKAAEGLYDGEYSVKDRAIFKTFSETKYSDSATRMLQDIYDHADNLLSSGKYEIAFDLFELIEQHNFSDSSDRMRDCRFEHVKALMNAGQYSEACTQINTYLSDYVSSDDTFKKCFYYYAEDCYANNLYDAAYTYYKRAGDYSGAADKAAKFELSYQSAKELMAIGKYEEAYSAFTALCDYSDSHDCASESLYLHADSLFANGEFQKAYNIFIALAEYKDSAQRAIDTNTAIWDARYDAANQLLTDKKYAEAIEAFEALDGYRDSEGKIAEANSGILDTQYDVANQLLTDKKYAEAIEAFEALDGYKNSAGKIEEAKNAILDIQYAAADQLLMDKKYAEAITAFSALDGYRDSEEKIENASTEMLAARYLEVEPIAFHLNGIPYVDEEKIKFSWGVEFDAASYTITLEYEDGTVYPLSSSNEKTLIINTRNLQTGLYKLRVGAVPAENNNENIIWNELQFGVIPSVISSASPGIPVIVPLGTSYNFYTEIDSSGTARRLNSEYPYEVLDLTMQVISHKDPEYYKENYDDTYILQGNEAAVEFVITLNDYNGTSKIIPQNFLLISVLGADQSTTSQGFQLMNAEIGGKTEVAIDNNSPATLYKRYSHSTDMGDAAYLVVTSYIDGEEYIYWFETFGRNNIAEKESLPIYIPRETPEISSGKPIAEGVLYPNGNLDVSGFAIRIDDCFVTEDPFLFEEGKITISWAAESGMESYYIYLYDGDGELMNKAEDVGNTELVVSSSNLNPGEVYTLKVGAMPIDGEAEDIIWQEIRLMRPNMLSATSNSKEPLVDGSLSQTDIKEAQSKLIALGLMEEGSADGIYNSETKEAVESFQERVNQLQGYPTLEATGIIDEKTMAQLYYYEAWWKEQQTAGSIPATTAIPTFTSETITGNSPQNQVISVQELLEKVGLLPIDFVNGNYDENTASAIKAFQRWVNQVKDEDTLDVTGEADSLTKAYLEYAVEHNMTVQVINPNTMSETPLGKPVISIDRGAYQKDGTIYIFGEKIIINWSAEGQPDRYYVYLVYEDGTEFELGETKKTSVTLSSSQLSFGQYKLFVGAIPKDGDLSEAIYSELRFAVPKPEDALIKYLDANSSQTDISKVQMALYGFGLLNEDNTTFGVLDIDTLKAVAQFQSMVNEQFKTYLRVIDPEIDGFVDTETLYYLLYADLKLD